MDKLKIWYFHNYTMLPEHGALNRGYYLGKYLQRLGHEPVVFAGSHPHNTRLQLVQGRTPCRLYQKKPFPWVLVRTRDYGGSRWQQVLSMFEFYHNCKKAAGRLPRPDVIVGSSAHPLAALLAVRLARKYHCKSVAEVRDLWPESLVAYGILPEGHPVARAMYWFERHLYLRADEVVFTMAGGYEYIKDRGWAGGIPKGKVHYVNNGVDLEEFEWNKRHYQAPDSDLDDPGKFCIVYAGAVKRANGLGAVLDAAKQVTDKRALFLIYGDGDELEGLRARAAREGVGNVRFKGRVDKKYIPYLLSRASLNYLHVERTGLLKYGISPNKLFDYFASGRPVLVDSCVNYSLVARYGAGTELKRATPVEIAREVERYLGLGEEAMAEYGRNALRAAEAFSYARLAEEFVEAIR